MIWWRAQFAVGFGCMLVSVHACACCQGKLSVFAAMKLAQARLLNVLSMGHEGSMQSFAAGACQSGVPSEINLKP